MKRNTVYLILVLAVILSFQVRSSGPATAAHGGVIHVDSCGELFIPFLPGGHFELTSDITHDGSTSACITIGRDGIKFSNPAGHTITGSGSSVGVSVSNQADVIVEDQVISGLARG